MYKFNTKKIDKIFLINISSILISFILAGIGLKIEFILALAYLSLFFIFLVLNLFIFNQAKATEIFFISTYNFLLTVFIYSITSLFYEDIYVISLTKYTNLIPLIIIAAGSVYSFKMVIEEKTLSPIIEQIQPKEIQHQEVQPLEPHLQEPVQANAFIEQQELDYKESEVAQPELNFIKTNNENQEPEEKLEEELAPLNELPSIDFKEEEDLTEVENQEELLKFDDNLTFSEATKDAIKNTLNINSQIRAHLAKSKYNAKMKHISAIGKILLNQRDLEQIIEANALMQNYSDESSKLNLIYAIDGDELNEMLNNIKQDNNIEDLCIVDLTGTLKAHNIQPGTDAYTVSSVSSLAFQVIENYIKQLWNINIESVFIQTNSKNVSISKIDKNIIYISGNKTYGNISNHEHQSHLTTKDANEIIKDPKFDFACIADLNGSLISTTDTNIENSSEIIVALFENIKTFVQSLKMESMQSIHIYTQDRVVIIEQSNDKITLFSSKDDFLMKENAKYSDVQAFKKLGSS